MTIADELRTYNATHNATGAHAMMNKGADLIDELVGALQELIGWVPGRQAWHTDAPEKAVERATDVLARTLSQP